jgi:hypothetical protein
MRIPRDRASWKIAFTFRVREINFYSAGVFYLRGFDSRRYICPAAS